MTYDPAPAAEKVAAVAAEHALRVDTEAAFPLETIENKNRLLAQAAAENWLCVFVHDAEHPWGYVRVGEDGKYEFEAAPEPAPARTH